MLVAVRETLSRYGLNQRVRFLDIAPDIVRSERRAIRYSASRSVDLVVWGNSYKGSVDGSPVLSFRLNYYTQGVAGRNWEDVQQFTRDLLLLLGNRKFDISDANSLRDYQVVAQNIFETVLLLIALFLLRRGDVREAVQLLHVVYMNLSARAQAESNSIAIAQKERLAQLLVENYRDLAIAKHAEGDDRAANLKSGRYFYYGCGTALKQGKQACGAKQISRHILEEFVIDRLKVEILTDENLRELVDLTNEELKGENAAEEEKLLGLDGQLEDLRERLKKLFLAVETGKFEEDDLAPRIREIKGQIEGLASVRSQLSQTLNLPVDPVDEALIRPFVKDLKNVLGKGSIVEQKSFLRSFVKKVEVRTREIAIEYTIPLGKAGEPFVKEVLSLERDGSPNGAGLEPDWWLAS